MFIQIRIAVFPFNMVEHLHKMHKKEVLPDDFQSPVAASKQTWLLFFDGNVGQILSVILSLTYAPNWVYVFNETE